MEPLSLEAAQRVWRRCRVYVINLRSRPDRLEHVRGELSRVGLDAYEVRTPDRDCADPGLGLIRNVRDALRQGLRVQEGARPILVLEDDVQFSPGALELLADVDAYMAAPQLTTCASWDTIRLGYNRPVFVERVADHLRLARGNCLATEAVMYHPAFAARLVRAFDAAPPGSQIDRLLCEQTGRTVMPLRPVTSQGAFGSDNVWPDEALRAAFLRDPRAYLDPPVERAAACFALRIPLCVALPWLRLRHFGPRGGGPVYETRAVCNLDEHATLPDQPPLP